VNDNAQSKLTLSSIAALASGLITFAEPRNYNRYLSLALNSARGKSWSRALILDLLLADVFVRQVRSTQPHFASLFLNAGAHIQHHYMFSSETYQGTQRNPEWYAQPGEDPVREVYELYDRILGTVLESFPSARLMLATGLHQVAHGEVTYYWRLKDHAAFLQQIGVEFKSVEPRMSRDFLITCVDSGAARRSAERLRGACTQDGTPLFEVDDRGNNLFVMLTYPREIKRDLRFSIGDVSYDGLHDRVAFVALKNGEHDGVGYFIDSGSRKGLERRQFPLTEIPERIFEAFGFV
jgi:hypothetical protein